jgi:hypothetical protein
LAAEAEEHEQAAAEGVLVEGVVVVARAGGMDVLAGRRAVLFEPLV